MSGCLLFQRREGEEGTVKENYHNLNFGWRSQCVSVSIVNMCIARENLVNEERELKQKQVQFSDTFAPNNHREARTNAMVSSNTFPFCSITSIEVVLFALAPILLTDNICFSLLFLVFRFASLILYSHRNVNTGPVNWCPKQRSIWINIGISSRRFWQRPVKT